MNDIVATKDQYDSLNVSSGVQQVSSDVLALGYNITTELVKIPLNDNENDPEWLYLFIKIQATVACFFLIVILVRNGMKKLKGT